MTQILKHKRPENGVIKLYLYEGEKKVHEKMELKKSRHEISSSRMNLEKSRSSIKDDSV